MLRTQLAIPVPTRRAWDLLIDTQAWPAWGPSVRAVDAPARCIGPGMRGRVQTTPGVWLPFVVTDWVEGHSWAWKVAGIPATGHVVEAVTPTTCRVTFAIPVWAPLYLPVCQLALRRLRDLAVGAAPDIG
jgi:hypothetical protein